MAHAKKNTPKIVKTFKVDGIRFTILAPQEAPRQITARPVGSRVGNGFARGRRSA